MFSRYSVSVNLHHCTNEDFLRDRGSISLIDSCLFVKLEKKTFVLNEE